MISKFLAVAIALIFFSFSGCSSFVESTRKSISGDSSNRKVKKDVKWVSKQQYDDLLAKYKTLNDKYDKLKDDKRAANPAAGEVASSETIDVFGKDGLTAEAAAQVADDAYLNSKGEYEKDLDYYHKAIRLKENGKNDEALKVFQFLEKSKSKQIVVRAKRQIGDIYFTKKNYDLALQVYEDIIRKNAFSGMVIKALEYAAKASAQLGLKDKQAKYESILKDFFEVRV